MRPFILLMLSACSLALVGCASPTVKYLQNPAQDSEGYIKFHLVGSNIVLAKLREETSSGATTLDTTTTPKASVLDVSATVVPKESKGNLYAIVPKSTWLWLVKTNLSATFFDNSRVIKQVGVTVEDNRLKAIQAVGAIASTAAALAPTPPPALSITLPVVIDPAEVGDQWEDLPSNIGWMFRIEYVSPKETAEERDAIAGTMFFANHEDGGWFNSTSVFPVSSCRHIHLKIRPKPEYEMSSLFTRHKAESDAQFQKRMQDVIKAKLGAFQNEISQSYPKANEESDEHYKRRIAFLVFDKYPSDHIRSFPLQVADPRFIRTVRMPDKGTITAHTICGADTKTEASAVTTVTDLLGELMKQAKSVYDAQKKKTEGQTPTK